jgi:hypothetical protein
MPVEVAEESDEEASVAALDTDELASLRTDCASALTEPANKAAAERAAVLEKRMLSREKQVLIYLFREIRKSSTTVCK